MGKRERCVDHPAFMDAVKETRGEGVAGAVGALHLGRRGVHRRLGVDAAVAARNHGAPREMHDDVLHGAHPEGCLRRSDAGVGVGPPFVDGLDAGDPPDLGVVDDEKVEMRQARPHDRGETLGRDARELEIGQEARVRAFLSVVTQPLSSSFHGPSIRRWMPGSPRWKMR